MVKTEISLTGFSFRYFDWSGKVLSKLFYSNGRAKIEETLEAAGLKIYPPAYLSLVGFLTFLSIPLTAIPILLIRPFLPTGIMGIIPWLFLILSPITVMFLGYAIPKIMAKNRAFNLDIEVPFAGAYISVMATGGLSPYHSLKRLKDFKLLPNISKAARNIEVDVTVKGLDPVTAMEKSAMNLPSRDYKDLLMGYASTLRSGGDVVHYLLIRTETMFRDLATKVKAFGERVAVLMESYIAITILTTLSLSIIYMTSIAFESFWKGFFTADSFLLYSYFLVPAISILFIYLTDASQIHQPVSEWGPYKVFLATTPFTIFLLLTTFLPFAIPGFALPFTRPIADFIAFFSSALGLERGYEASIGLALTLMASAIPAAVAHSYYTKRGRGVEHDVTNFLRDLTEARKTGATPEKCIQNLSGRSYGRLTKHLKVASRQIGWGLPFKVIYETFRTKLKSWLALINISLLVDAIEVGGGTPETLETMTRFSEMLSSLEKEKRATLRPLLIMPYIGAGVLLFSTVVFLQFMRFVLQSFGRQAMPFGHFVTLLLPPLVLQAYLTGIVTGKMSSESLSAGFKHAAILVVVAIILILLSSRFAIPFMWG